MKNTNDLIQAHEEKRKKFLDSIVVKDTEASLLLNLQKRFRKGEIKEIDLTEQQKKDLCDLYDKQIEELKSSNEARRKKLLII